jgi:hypothetical protein
MSEELKSTIESEDKLENIPKNSQPEKSIEAKRENPSMIMNFLKRIRDTFRPAILAGSEDILTDKMKDELAAVEKMATREGVNFAKCQMDELAAAYQKGEEVEFEALSPYLADYNTATGEIWADKLTKSDAIGLAVSRLLRAEFSQARLISLYDEYNSGMPDSSNFSGAPTREAQTGAVISDAKKGKIDAPQLAFPEATKENFKASLKDLFQQNGVIGKGDREGENYLFVSESSKVASAEKLIEKLEAKGKIERRGQEIHFVDPEAENPAYRKIILRSANGRWLCEALDASSYLDEKNLAINHLVILPNQFMEQQDKVWEILRTIGIKSSKYHNIFYDENTPPEKVVSVIREEIEEYLK